MRPSPYYTDDHEAWRETVRRFVEIDQADLSTVVLKLAVEKDIQKYV